MRGAVRVNEPRTQTKEDATRRSRGDTLLWLFGPMLFVSVCVYVFLHWPNTLCPDLSLRPTEAKIALLKNIAQARRVSADEAGRGKLVQIVFGDMRENLNTILFVHSNASALQKMQELEQETARSKSDPEKTKVLLMELDREVRTWNWYFWSTVPWRLVEILFWGWFGTLLYLLKQIYEHYRLATPKRYEYFLVNTPRYFVVASQGTLTVFGILLFVSSIRIGGTGIEITPEQVSIELLVFLALTLGFYNRVASIQLDLIIAAVFAEAWRRTQKKLEITPSSAEVSFGKVQSFRAEPEDAQVRWSIDPEKGLEKGAIDESSGLYRAPERQTGDGDAVERVVVVRATRFDDPTVSTCAVVTLVDSHPDGTPDASQATSTAGI
jgi:hypothetical protein